MNIYWGHGGLRLYPENPKERKFLNGLLELVDGVEFKVSAVDENPDLTKYAERRNKESQALDEGVG